MNLKSIFKKPVDRPIEGVIKADDAAKLRMEIEEYVLTDEVQKRLDAFLDAYNNDEGSNGVWVSGFFGSGKSHLLKILALLLENRSIEETCTLDLFLPKCTDDSLLRANLIKAVSIPSKSILFNIDQKADIISKTEIDALLGVFVKVFNEMCGYYGKLGHIAQFERDLDSRGLYEKFKTAYNNLTNRSWEKGRERALMETKNISEAYALTSGDETTTNILDKYRNQYKVSIEDFAEQVQEYLDKQPSTFRLNFFVDEVGQFIAENVKLMTNLQTIAESLATKCKGRAWVIVTAQEDMDKVVGQMSQQKSHDFSRIQARFAIRMKLTSADVSEVIQKRLLTKNDEGVKHLTQTYENEHKNFKTLFNFADGSASYVNFLDEEHFINCYPFIPYQFALFQSAIQSLSLHNAFEGKHSSVGERSMLGVFRDVAMSVSDCLLGQLASFEKMFEGIRTALKSNIQRAILQAEKHVNNSLAVRLLKCLFLVKYVQEFKPTIRNLCILLYDRLDQDLPTLRKQVEEALNLLEQQTYIQRNGELYEYLTDEEKDIEEEIKNGEVTHSEIADELEKIIFNHIIKSSKIRYEDNGQDYPYSKKIDDQIYGKGHELSIHIITPFNQNAENERILLLNHIGKDELLVIIPTEERLVHEIRLYKQMEKYIRQKTATLQKESIKSILTEKSFQNNERYSRLQNLIKDLLVKAKLFVSGSQLENSTEDPQKHLFKGFHELISRVYPHLRMLRKINYTESDINKCLKRAQDSFPTMSSSLPEAEQEMLSIIQSNNQMGQRTTLKQLVERFERKPYGWSYAGILCTIAYLWAKDKVELRSDSNLIEEKGLAQALQNTHGHGNVLLTPRIEYTASQIRQLREFYEEFFDEPIRHTEAKALENATAAAFQNLKGELTDLAAQKGSYPFLEALNSVLEQIKAILNKSDSAWYLTEFCNQHDSLLEVKEKVIDPIFKFMNGPQKDIFDRARHFVQFQQYNFSYLEGLEAKQMIDILEDSQSFKGNCMQQVKGLLNTLEQKVDAQIKLEIAEAKESVDPLRRRICTMAEFASLLQEQQEQIIQKFNAFSESIEGLSLIAKIRDECRRFQEFTYQQILSQVTSWAHSPQSLTSSDCETLQPIQKQNKMKAALQESPCLEYVPSRSVVFPFDKAWLADAVDVDRYLNSMRGAFLEEILKGKRIQV